MVPTSVAVSTSGIGVFAAQYATIASMIPMALAARDANGPALIVFTRSPWRRPASYASVRVSLSSAALADDIPPPYPGITRSPAMYDNERNDPLGRISGASWRTMLTSEYALTPIAER